MSKSEGYMTGDGVGIGVLERMPKNCRKNLRDLMRATTNELLENLKGASYVLREGENEERFNFEGFRSGPESMAIDLRMNSEAIKI